LRSVQGLLAGAGNRTQAVDFRRKFAIDVQSRFLRK
jgi:hypothetical protein